MHKQKSKATVTVRISLRSVHLVHSRMFCILFLELISYNEKKKKQILPRSYIYYVNALNVAYNDVDGKKPNDSGSVYIADDSAERYMATFFKLALCRT